MGSNIFPILSLPWMQDEEPSDATAFCCIFKQT